MHAHRHMPSQPAYRVRLAVSEQDVAAAQRLRYDVFVRELGGSGPDVDHDAGLEKDRFDPFFDHMLVECTQSDTVVGVYRLLREDQAQAAGQFYSEDEYDLTRLRTGGRRLMELGRSCMHPAHRGGPAMFLMWQGLSDYVARHEIEILFGVASFHGTDVPALGQALSLMHHRHLAPEDLRVTSRIHQAMDLVPEAALDRPRALRDIPALIKAYLRLGGVVGDGAFVDHRFNTTDVCLVLDTARMTARARDIYRSEKRP